MTVCKNTQRLSKGLWKVSKTDKPMSLPIKNNDFGEEK